MKVLVFSVCCLFVAVAADMVQMPVKGRNGQDKLQDLCTPFSPMRCRMMCPPGSEGITDGCGRCACISIGKAVCQIMCPKGQRLYPPCHCIPYNEIPIETESMDPCQQNSDTGMCKAYFSMFFYNSASGRCEKFVYGGCGGNSNRFKTIGECKAACM